MIGARTNSVIDDGTALTSVTASGNSPLSTVAAPLVSRPVFSIRISPSAAPRALVYTVPAAPAKSVPSAAGWSIN